MRSKEVAGVIGRIKEAIKHYGLTAADLGYGKAASPASTNSGAKATTKGVAKYMDKATGKTWTGRGKPPSWIAAAADRSVYLIDGSPAGALPPKRGGVAKYQDPQSGKTWTGMGKPPAWIAGAKDRSVYLIGASNSKASKSEPASDAGAEGVPAAAEAPGAKPSGRAKRAAPKGRRVVTKVASKKAPGKGRVASKSAKAASSADAAE